MAAQARPGLLVLAASKESLGSLIGSPNLTPGTGTLGIVGIEPIVPVGSRNFTVPAGAIAFSGRSPSINNVYARPGIFCLGSSHRSLGALSDPANVEVHSIDSGVITQYLRPSALVDGLRFKAAQGGGSVEIGGVTQTIISWADEAIEIGPIARGTLKYGTHDLTVTNDDGRSASLPITLNPASGWFYVNLGTSNSDVDALLPTDPALDASTNYSGWQVSYGNFTPSGPGYAIVYADATFAYGNGLASFEAEINDGSGWGATGEQEFNVNLAPDVAALSFTGYAPTILQTTNTLLAPPTGALGLTGVIPALVETTSRNFTVPTGTLRFRGSKPQGRAMYGLGSGGLGTGGLAGRNRDELTAGVGISENVQ